MLEVGNAAPNFELNDQNGKTVKLADFKGQRLILYFYPKDDTPGCTAESCNLRDNYTMLLQHGYKVLGVSCDDEASHQAFIKKFNLPFPLLADVDQKMVNDYGVWGEKNMFGNVFMGIKRTTFVIDANGVIEQIIRKVDTENHTEQILNKVKS